MKIYGIYDLKNKEQCVLVGTIIEIIKFFNLSARAFGRALTGSKINSRYELVYLFKED